jgi:hypothetical protein
MEQRCGNRVAAGFGVLDWLDPLTYIFDFQSAR